MNLSGCNQPAVHESGSDTPRAQTPNDQHQDCETVNSTPIPRSMNSSAQQIIASQPSSDSRLSQIRQETSPETDIESKTDDIESNINALATSIENDRRDNTVELTKQLFQWEQTWHSIIEEIDVVTDAARPMDNCLNGHHKLDDMLQALTAKYGEQVNGRQLYCNLTRLKNIRLNAFKQLLHLYSSAPAHCRYLHMEYQRSDRSVKDNLKKHYHDFEQINMFWDAETFFKDVEIHLDDTAKSFVNVYDMLRANGDRTTDHSSGESAQTLARLAKDVIQSWPLTIKSHGDTITRIIDVETQLEQLKQELSGDAYDLPNAISASNKQIEQSIKNYRESIASKRELRRHSDIRSDKTRYYINENAIKEDQGKLFTSCTKMLFHKYNHLKDVPLGIRMKIKTLQSEFRKGKDHRTKLIFNRDLVNLIQSYLDAHPSMSGPNKKKWQDFLQASIDLHRLNAEMGMQKELITLSENSKDLKRAGRDLENGHVLKSVGGNDQKVDASLKTIRLQKMDASESEYTNKVKIVQLEIEMQALQRTLFSSLENIKSLDISLPKATRSKMVWHRKSDKTMVNDRPDFGMDIRTIDMIKEHIKNTDGNIKNWRLVSIALATLLMLTEEIQTRKYMAEDAGETPLVYRSLSYMGFEPNEIELLEQLLDENRHGYSYADMKKLLDLGLSGTADIDLSLKTMKTSQKRVMNKEIAQKTMRTQNRFSQTARAALFYEAVHHQFDEVRMGQINRELARVDSDSTEINTSIEALKQQLQPAFQGLSQINNKVKQIQQKINDSVRTIEELNLIYGWRFDHNKLNLVDKQIADLYLKTFEIRAGEGQAPEVNSQEAQVIPLQFYAKKRKHKRKWTKVNFPHPSNEEAREDVVSWLKAVSDLVDNQIKLNSIRKIGVNIQQEKSRKERVKALAVKIKQLSERRRKSMGTQNHGNVKTLVRAAIARAWMDVGGPPGEFDPVQHKEKVGDYLNQMGLERIHDLPEFNEALISDDDLTHLESWINTLSEVKNRLNKNFFKSLSHELNPHHKSIDKDTLDAVNQTIDHMANDHKIRITAIHALEAGMPDLKLPSLDFIFYFITSGFMGMIEIEKSSGGYEVSLKNGFHVKNVIGGGGNFKPEKTPFLPLRAGIEFDASAYNIDGIFLKFCESSDVKQFIQHIVTTGRIAPEALKQSLSFRRVKEFSHGLSTEIEARARLHNLYKFIMGGFGTKGEFKIGRSVKKTTMANFGTMLAKTETKLLASINGELGIKGFATANVSTGMSQIQQTVEGDEEKGPRLKTSSFGDLLSWQKYIERSRIIKTKQEFNAQYQLISRGMDFYYRGWRLKKSPQSAFLNLFSKAEHKKEIETRLKMYANEDRKKLDDIMTKMQTIIDRAGIQDDIVVKLKLKKDVLALCNSLLATANNIRHGIGTPQLHDSSHPQKQADLLVKAAKDLLNNSDNYTPASVVHIATQELEYKSKLLGDGLGFEWRSQGKYEHPITTISL